MSNEELKREKIKIKEERDINVVKVKVSHR